MLLLGPAVLKVSGDDTAKQSSPAMQLAALGMKFNGASSCKGSACHSKPGSDAPPTETGHEYNIWKDNDQHSKAFDTLKSKDSAAIGEKLKISDVQTSDRCLSCHALNVKSDLQGDNFNLNEGNTCESCHGPSEKWLKVHTQKGWQDDMRAKMSHDELLHTWGLYDTRPLVVRAQMCASCHLAIDADMVAAGHPQPTFELAYFSDSEPKHWIDKGGYFNTKVWMAGQVVCVREAMEQLSDRVKSKADADAISKAWQQAMAHATVFQAAVPVAGLDQANYDSHLKALGALSPDAGDKITAEADAIAKICADGKSKVADFDPDANKAATTQILSALAGLTNMGKNFGQFGMDQQSMGIYALYSSNWTATMKKSADQKIDDDATFKLILAKLFPDKAPSPDDFDKNVAAVKDQLPK